MRVGVLSPTTRVLVEKMAVLFPEGIEVVGPLADDQHYWNDYRRLLPEWEEVGLRISLNLAPFDEQDFSRFDLLIESAETFLYGRDWANHCLRVECPIVLKACWTRDPKTILPPRYVERVKDYPVLLEMPSHAPLWETAGFEDVNVIFNPSGDWLFGSDWDGGKEQILLVLSGTREWRGDAVFRNGLDLWERLQRAFPGQTFHHDGHESYRTTREMAELYAASRVFVNLDRPYGEGERPLSVAFSEAMSLGLPVVAQDLPGLNYGDYIDSNGVCTTDFDAMRDFIEMCLQDIDYARERGARSRGIARGVYSYEALRPRYGRIFRRARRVFEREQAHRRGSRLARFFQRDAAPTSGDAASSGGDVFGELERLYASRIPAGYEIRKEVDRFYSDPAFWETMRDWEKTPESYSVRDKEFVESAFEVDDSRIINIGCYYPWAEMEWGRRTAEWVALDINPSVISRARDALGEHPGHHVSFFQADITEPLQLGRRFDAVLDLSTFDQLDPARLSDVLCNYTRLSDRLILAYDATSEPLAEFDFASYGFNAKLNPATVVSMIEQMGYRILDHRPFAYESRSYLAAQL